MNNNPLVSIIIPVYNGANFVKYAIESAINQTYKNIEIIVVNDGSSDNGKTEKEILKYKKYIKYIKKKNGGVSSALNLAISQMKGEYFSWLSHDDEYELNKIEKQIDFLKNNNLLNKNIVLYSNYKLIDINGNVISECYKNSYELNKKPLYSILRGAINGLTLLIPKAAFKKCGNFDVTKKCTQDYELWWKMLKEYKFVHQNIYTAKTRIHSNQVTNTNPKVITEGNEMWKRFINELSEKEMIELDGSKYSFYKGMSDFLKDTVYKEAYTYCEKKYLEIEKSFIMDDSLVSVIIPTYNRELVTIEAIKSVLNQDYKNIEIIVVDDCSTVKIDKLKKYVKNYSNIKLICLKKNVGAAAARNIGIKKSCGKYIAFLDSDDIFLKNKISTQLKIMQLTNSKISHTSYIRHNMVNNKDELIKSGQDNGWILGKLIYSCGIATPTVMIERNFLLKNNLFFYENMTIGEDTCFWLEIIKRTPIFGIKDSLTIVNTGDCSASVDREKMIVGYKTIINHVLNDELFSTFDREIALLTADFSKIVLGESIIDFYKQRYDELLNSKSMKITKPLRILFEKIRILREKIK